jgi:outer membrane protein with beta-barrel domain
MRTSGIVLAAMLCLAARPAFAQEPRGFVGGGFTLSTWGARDAPSSASLQFAKGDGATVPGFFGEASVAVGRRFSVGGELALAARNDTTQVSTYLFGAFQRQNRYRDMTVAGLAHFHARTHGVVRPSVVGGFELVQQSLLARTAEGRFAPPNSIQYGPFGDEIATNDWTVGTVVGGDVAVAASSRISIVPQIRLHLIRRDDVTQTLGTVGLTTTVWRVGVGVRARF